MERLKRFLSSLARVAVHPAVLFVLRVVLGGVFVFSGFVKAIDPWGSYYKFSEYVNALHMSVSDGHVLFLAFAVAIVEFVLGVCIVTGAYRRGALITAMTMVGFMLPLTGYLAVTDAVKDCGCFGDAWVLSNTATFLKNVVLMALLYFLLQHNRRVTSFYGPAVHWVVGALSFAFALAVALYGYFVQPLIDFRPYGVGTNLVTENASPAGESDNYTFVYEKDGEQVTFTMDSLPDEEDGWTFVERRGESNEPSPAMQQALQPISVSDEGIDVTDDVFTAEGETIILLFPDLRNIDISAAYPINRLTEAAGSSGTRLVALTAATAQDVAWWNDLSMATYPICTSDDSDIKMLARGNPAVVYLHNGVIAWKRTLSSLDTEKINEIHDLAQWGEDFNPQATLLRLVTIYLLSLLGLLILNRGYLLVGLIYKVIKKPANKHEKKSEESAE